MSRDSRGINVIVADHSGSPFWEAKFRRDGLQVKRRIGPAWLVPAGSRDARPGGKTYKGGQWIQRRGRPGEGTLSYDEAVAAAPALVEAYAQQRRNAAAVVSAEATERSRPRTFRELAHAWRASLDRKGTKPSTLVGYDAMLAEPGAPFKRGEGAKLGYIMAAFGCKAARDVTAGDVEALLATINEAGATARTVEKHRIMVRSILNYGIRETKRAQAGTGSVDGHDYGLMINAAQVAEGPRQKARGMLVYYLPEEVEAVAHALESGRHHRSTPRHQPDCANKAGETCDCIPSYWVGRLSFDDAESAATYLREQRDEAQILADVRDAAAVRVAAYTGLRLGELLALRWSDIDWNGSAITVSRAISAGKETTTKSGKIRRVPLPDQAALALKQLSRRDDFTAAAEFIFCNVVTGRQLDGSALRRRYKEAQTAAGVHALRWHDLRHTYGSLLAASGEELVTIKAAMGHANITTTEVYLHARPATELAGRFTTAFAPRSTTGDIQHVDGNKPSR